MDAQLLSEQLLPVESVTAENLPNHRAAAVLVPIFEEAGELKIIFTKRPRNLRRHAGEISFPGGLPEAGEDSLLTTAQRETEEEIGLSRHLISVIGGLEPISTFVTRFAVHPYVAVIEGNFELQANPGEVEKILTFSANQLKGSYSWRRLIRLGIPIKAHTFNIDGELIWGATARIVTDLLKRIGEIPVTGEYQR